MTLLSTAVSRLSHGKEFPDESEEAKSVSLLRRESMCFRYACAYACVCGWGGQRQRDRSGERESKRESFIFTIATYMIFVVF